MGLNYKSTGKFRWSHLGNDSVLGMIHEARMRLLADKGFSENDIDGVGILMIDSVINFSSEGFYGDKLRVDVIVNEISNTGCDIYYRFVNIANEKVIVKARTNIAFYNYLSKKVTRTPEIFLNTFK